MWEGIKACNARAGFCGKEEVMAQIKFILEELLEQLAEGYPSDGYVLYQPGDGSPDVLLLF